MLVVDFRYNGESFNSKLQIEMIVPNARFVRASRPTPSNSKLCTRFIRQSTRKIREQRTGVHVPYFPSFPMLMCALGRGKERMYRARSPIPGDPPSPHFPHRTRTPRGSPPAFDPRRPLIKIQTPFAPRRVLRHPRNTPSDSAPNIAVSRQRVAYRLPKKGDTGKKPHTPKNIPPKL